MQEGLLRTEEPPGVIDVIVGRDNVWIGRLSATWLVDGHEVPARLFKWAGAWAGFTTAVARVDIVAVGHAIDGSGLPLVELTDTAAYHFDHRSPIVLPDDAERGLTAQQWEGDRSADLGWPLHPDHDDLSSDT